MSNIVDSGKKDLLVSILREFVDSEVIVSGDALYQNYSHVDIEILDLLHDLIEIVGFADIPDDEEYNDEDDEYYEDDE